MCVCVFPLCTNRDTQTQDTHKHTDTHKGCNSKLFLLDLFIHTHEAKRSPLWA